MEKIRGKLAQIDEELKAACGNDAFASSIANGSLHDQITKALAELWEAKKDLAEKILMYPEAEKMSAASGSTNALVKAPEPEMIEEYAQTIDSLRTFKKRQREYEDQGLRESHPTVAAIIERVQKLNTQRAKLEREFPGIAQFAAVPSRIGTNDPAASALIAAGEIRILKARVTALDGFLLPFMETQPKIAKLVSQRAEQQKTYDSIVRSLDTIRSKKADNLKSIADMSVVDPPSPPKIDYKKFLKLIGIAFGGCVGLGFGLAFLIDMILDRTIRRTTDVEKHLHMPVFLSIPDAGWNPKSIWPWRKRKTPAADGNGNAHGDEAPATETALTPWAEGHYAAGYSEGLRERLLTYFEVNNLNLKKPKLVALAGCGTGSGVTTLASGLAAALSKTGDNNVLFVDMNSEHAIAHSFINGKPGCAASDMISLTESSDEHTPGNGVLTRMADVNGGMGLVAPSRFKTIVPKLKASDYDYIIFDMPPVSPTSITPRMASHMDIVLLVLESEKTGQHRAAKASSLMRESRANVAAVLNKCRQHVPEALSQEL
jgi:Mrp family chromosome partitioning ATPase